MGTNRFMINKFDGLPEALSDAYDAEDWGACRETLKTICEIVPHETLAANVTRNYKTALQFFDIFMKTGLDTSPHKSRPRKLFLETVNYLVKHAPPELRAELSREFESISRKLKPAGFTDSGKPCYTLKHLAEVFDLHEEEILAFVEPKYLISRDKVNDIQ